jgi:hypothetical protein
MFCARDSIVAGELTDAGCFAGGAVGAEGFEEQAIKR